MADYYALKPDEVLKTLNAPINGLTEHEAKKRLDEYGYNELQRGRRTTAFVIFLRQFKNGLILMLIFADILSLCLGDYPEAIAIFAIIIINTILGFSQEYNAEKAIEALEKISAPTARVMRDGEEKKIPAREVVPGDILLLEAGDILSTDARLIELSSMQVDEACLTGESVPSKKVIEPFKHGTSVSDQENMAFMSTIVTYGKGKAVVTATGMNTELGKIAHSLQKIEDIQTPLQKKFTQLSKQIGIVAAILVIIVLITGTLQGTMSFGMMLFFALALTVSTIPNSLPIIVTVCLSMGAKRLARKNMLIKKLPAAESLGAATIICSDKTGTITKNQMTITSIYTNNQIITVTGTGYIPEGNFFINDQQINPKQLELFIRAGYLCNNSKLSENNGVYSIIGDPTEGAFIVLGKKGKIEDHPLHAHFSLIEELPFDSDRKSMSVIYTNRLHKKTEAYVKGAPDMLLEKCSRIIEKGRIRKITAKDRKKILDMNNSFAEDALRVLALAYKELPASKKYDIKTAESNLIFVGLAGMIDPPRDEVRASVKECHDAGIEVMIITGDHAITTKAVARQIGLFKEGDIILTGSEIEKMSDKELEEKIEHVRIIARALPIQKSRVVDALKNRGHIVAMTGDGVNDAPALKKADIGIAMGITGTDVAKEVSKATLVDDNFSTIVNAIEEGRNIYNKIINSAKYLLSCNSGEITSVFMAIMLGFPLPMLPLQLLLMNILTDEFPALGLGFESKEEGIMNQRPRNPKEKPITGKIFASIILFGIIMGLGTLFMFARYANTDIDKARTVAFTTLVIFQMFAVMSSRTLHSSIKQLNPFSNMWLFGAVCLSLAIQLIVIYYAPLQAVFGTVPLLLADWLGIIGISSLGFVMMETGKFVMKI